MAGRLLVLVLLPLAVLTSVSGPLVLRTRRDSDKAKAIVANVPAVTSLIGAVAALEVEQGKADAVLHPPEVGVPVAVAGKLLGLDLVAEMRTARAVTDRAMSSLPRAIGDPIVSKVGALRTLMDKRAAKASLVDGQFQQVESDLNALSTSKLNDLERAAASTSNTQTISRSLITLGWTNDVVQAIARQSGDLNAVWFGPAAGRAEAAITLAHDTALFDAAGQRVAQSDVQSVSESWADLVADPLSRKIGALFVAAEHGMTLPTSGGKVQERPSATINVADLTGAVKGISARWQRVLHIVDEASATVKESARSLAHSSSRTYELWLTLTLGAIVVTAAVAMVVARSISRPLARLAHAATSVVDGDLDVDRLASRGPKETAVVADALNALVANLRILQSKTDALASGRLDDPVLSVPLPGSLGRSLQDSARLMSGSIEAQDALRERLAHQATHDAMTGLLNRPAAIAAIEHALARAARGPDNTALLYINLDNFKQANDLCGHSGGDRILNEVGVRLSANVRAGDVVARLGGDEFLILAERVENLDEAQELADRLIDKLAEPIEWVDHRLRLGAAVGIALDVGDDANALDLLGRADLALYQAKQLRGRRVAVFDEALQQQLAERDEIEGNLRDALANDGVGLELYFQPEVDAATGALKGVEALIRWHRPGEGLVSPDRFIPIAETSDTIIDVDDWVLAAAARQMVIWSGDPQLARLRVSVNVSGRHLISRRVPGRIRQMLADPRVDPHNLTIEITETVLLDDLDVAAAELNQIRELGVTIAVDDFGTGYTSLSHLQHLAVDIIKIDRSFVLELDRTNDPSLIRMIIELGHHLGLLVVTEGVDATSQLDTLRELGSDLIQGYLIAPPMPADQLAAWERAEPSQTNQVSEHNRARARSVRTPAARRRFDYFCASIVRPSACPAAAMRWS